MTDPQAEARKLAEDLRDAFARYGDAIYKDAANALDAALAREREREAAFEEVEQAAARAQAETSEAVKERDELRERAEAVEEALRGWEARECLWSPRWSSLERGVGDETEVLIQGQTESIEAVEGFIDLVRRMLSGAESEEA